MPFVGFPHTRWEQDGRTMVLLETFKYIDRWGKEWVAEEGLKMDGASIPRFAWRIIGSPYTGKYRRAAILHDAYYINPRGETRKAVDKMFKQAMREAGVSPWKAQVMYHAVRIFGPRW